MKNQAPFRSLVSAVILLSSIAFFQGCSKGTSEEDLKKFADMQETIDAKDAALAKEAQRATALEEAKRLAEAATATASAAEATRTARLAEQIESEKAERAQLESMLSELKANKDAISQEQMSLKNQLEQAVQARAAAADAAAKKVEMAEAALARSEANKQSEIKAARDAALAEALARMEARAEKGGYTPASAVVTSRKRESISAFLSVQIAERNHQNNTRRTTQRRESGQ